MQSTNPMNEPNKPLKRREFLKNATPVAALALGAPGWRSLLAAAEPDAPPRYPRAPSPASRTPRLPPIQIGILLGTFGRGTLEDRLDAVKACGLDCVQVSLDCARHARHARDIRRKLPADHHQAADRGITIASVQGTFNMSHPDRARRAGLRRLRVMAEACSQLGTSKIHICTGTRDRNNMWRRHPDNDLPASWRDMAACVREATDIAQNRTWSSPLSPRSTTS